LKVNQIFYFIRKLRLIRISAKNAVKHDTSENLKKSADGSNGDGADSATTVRQAIVSEWRNMYERSCNCTQDDYLHMCAKLCRTLLRASWVLTQKPHSFLMYCVAQ